MMEWTGASLPHCRREAHYGDRIVSCFVKRPASLADMRKQAVEANPDGEAIVCGDERWTWKAVDAEASVIAAALAERGICTGDRVALLLGNRAEFVLALFAILRLGAIAVPLSMRYQTPEIVFALKDCGAAMLIHEAHIAPRLPETEEIPSVRLRIVLGNGGTPLKGAEPWDALMRASTLPETALLGEEDVAVILYTSGTTGRPKGAMLTHLSLISSALVYRHCFEMTKADRSIAAVPLAHVTGLVADILTIVACSGCIVILPEFKAQAFLALAERERMTHTIAVPAMYNLCLLTPDFGDRDLSSWRIGGFGGRLCPSRRFKGSAKSFPASS